MPVMIGLIFYANIHMGIMPSAESAFLTMSLYEVARLSMIIKFQGAVEKLTETLISIRRIQEFLLLEEVREISNSQQANRELMMEKNMCYVKLKQVAGKWNEDAKRNALDGISFEAISGQLSIIVGPVGSGKGSILQAILGTYIIGKFKSIIYGIVAYLTEKFYYNLTSIIHTLPENELM